MDRIWAKLTESTMNYLTEPRFDLSVWILICDMDVASSVKWCRSPHYTEIGSNAKLCRG